MSEKYSVISGTGICLSDLKITSDELEKRIGYSDERQPGWIKKMTGIEERFWCSKKDMFDMAIDASDLALKDSSSKSIDTIIIARSRYTDPKSPTNAGAIHLGLKERGYDFAEVDYVDGFLICSGFLSALNEASLRIKTGQSQKALVVASSKSSAFVNYSHPQSACLWGDAAGAFVVESSEKPGIIYYKGIGLPNLWDSFSLNYSTDGKPFIDLNGKQIYHTVLTYVPHFIRNCLTQANITIENIDLFLFHQANGRLLNSLCNALHIPPQKTYNNIQRYGNTTCASIPILFHEAKEKGMMNAGKTCLMASFGAGFHMNCLIYKVA